MGGINLFARVDWKKLKLLVSWPSKLQELTTLTPFSIQGVFFLIRPFFLPAGQVPKDSRFQPLPQKPDAWDFHGFFPRQVAHLSAHGIDSLYLYTWPGERGEGKPPKPSSGGSGMADRLLPRLVHLERGLYGIVGIKSGTGTWVCMPKQRWYVL